MSSTTALFLIAAFQIAFIDGARPDYKYINATRAWYKYHEERVSWHDASDTCRSERAVLFHPDSGDEAREVTAGLSVPASWTWIHSGFSDLMRADHYETMDGRALEQVYRNWWPGYPAAGSSQGYRCGVLDVGDLTLRVWPCNYARPFICKAAADPALEDAQNTIANLTAKIADLERELANQKTVLNAVKEEAQATKIQDYGNRITALELLIANQTAALKDISREEKIVEALERISKSGENQAAGLERISKADENQAVGLERISKAVENQAVGLERISKAVENQAVGLERISKADENQAIQLKQLIETMQRLAVNQTAIMERQALALETMANSSSNEQQ